MFQEQSGVGRGLEIFLSLFGVFLIWWVLWSVFDMLMEGEFGEYIKVRKFVKVLRRMENHYIIAGGGRVGEELAKGLLREHKECIIIEKNLDTVGRLRKKDYIVMQGDAHDESLLKQAGIMSAHAMIITLPDPEKALVATMIAKEVNERLDVYVRCENPSFVTKLKKAGAKAVIVPEAVAADKIMEEINKDL
jgi:voltage-gated potassium channel